MLAKILVSSSLENLIIETAKILGTDYKKHPDILVLESGEKLGIEQVRIIKEHLSYKPFQAKGRGVSIEDASSLTPEAQNALLKTLEELPENSILIMGTNSENNLLPTILSRCEIITITPVIPAQAGIPLDTSTQDKVYEEINNLVYSNLEVRFEYIEKLKDKKEFLGSLISYFQSALLDEITMHSTAVIKDVTNHAPGQHLASVEVKNFLKELLEAEKWINQNVNPRGILEYLMLIMPKS